MSKKMSIETNERLWNELIGAGVRRKLKYKLNDRVRWNRKNEAFEEISQIVTIVNIYPHKSFDYGIETDAGLYRHVKEHELSEFEPITNTPAYEIGEDVYWDGKIGRFVNQVGVPQIATIKETYHNKWLTYRIETTEGRSWIVMGYNLSELKPISASGDYVCDEIGIIYEIDNFTDKHYFNLTRVYDDSYYVAEDANLYRPATNEDWGVSYDGVRWNASQDKHGRIWLYADGTQVLLEYRAGHGGNKYRNKITKQLCVSLCVPIKPFNEKDNNDIRSNP